MSTQPLTQAISVARDVLANVTPEQMQNATPCASWDVAGLINHMVGGQHFFRAGMDGVEFDGELPDFAAGDYKASFDEAAAACVDCFSADGAMEKTVLMPFGEFPGAGFMGMAMTDTFQHAWDLAKATGQDTNLAPELAAGILAQSKQSIQDAFRGPEGAPFGAEAHCADDACAADRLAAFLGREV